ncbi:MAG: PH domain-containing protein [Candidatus Hodarchaeales archaeon]|jgi:membrane protein YdbS with pleckstrin-like domain
MHETEFEDIKDYDERILVSFKPTIMVNLVRSFSGLLLSLFGSPFLLAGLFVMAFGMIGPEEGSFDVVQLIAIPFGAVFVFVGGAMVFWPLFLILLTPRKVRNTIHAITGKRIITRSGSIGTDFTSVPFHSIKEVDIDINFLDRIFRTGTLSIKGLETENSVNIVELANFNAIKNPLTVRDTIKRELQFLRV